MKFKLTITLLSVLKLWLVIAIPLTAAYLPHDDLLFLNLAGSFSKWLAVANESWLGPYTQNTLVKGPTYPIWIAFNFMVGLPLLLAQNLLYIISGLILVVSLRKIITHSSILIVLYAAYIFNPEFITRAIREGIYPALTVLIIAGLISIYVHREATLSKLSLWAAFLGIIMSAFWMLREEGIWIIPSFLLLLGYILFRLYRTFGTSHEFLKRATICFLPLVILFGNIQLLSLINKIYYDVYTVVEVKSPGFLSAYGALSRVKHPHFNRYIPVPKEVRQMVYSISPAFKELQPFLEGPLQAWGIHLCRVHAESCGDLGGSFFMWALRDAVAMAGYYQSGSTAENYYLRLAQEVNTACDKQQLDCLEKRATLTPPFRKEYIPLLAEALLRGTKIIVNFEGYSQSLGSPLLSSGPEESLAIFPDLTREKIAPFNTQPPTIIRGWAFSPTETVHLRVQSRDSSQLDNFSIQKHPSPDVDEHFNQLYQHAKNSRFTVTSTGITNCELVFYTDKSVLATVNLADSQETKILSDSVFFFHIDSVTAQPDTTWLLPRQNRVDAVKVKILQGIAKIYYASIPWLFYLALGLYFLSVVKLALSRQVTFLWILNTAILGAILFRLLILSYIDITSFPGFLYHYLAPLYSLLLIFIGLTIVAKLEYVVSKA